MKLLLLIVSTFAVFAVDCRDIPDEGIQVLSSEPEFQGSPEENNQDLDDLEVYRSENEEKELNDRNLVVAKGTDDVEFPEENDSSAKQTPEDDSSEEDEDGSNSRKLRRSRCKARNACVVMAGFCVTNATLCTGRLVPEGCKGTNCKCCVPGTLENKIEELDDEIESMQTNLNGAKLNINMTLTFMEDKILDSISNISSKLDNYMEHADIEVPSSGAQISTTASKITTTSPPTTTTKTTTKTTTTTTAATTGCPQGFFTAGSRQCFKYFNATKLNWANAKAKCQSEGLMLAKPIDPVALRTYVKDFDTSYNRWIGGRGAGSYLIWDRDGQQISNTNSLWWPGQPGSSLSTSYCLAMPNGNSNPTKAFFSFSCTNARPFVCERVMN